MHLMLFTGDDVKKLQSPRQFESQNRLNWTPLSLITVINMHLEFFGVVSHEKRLTCKP